MTTRLAPLFANDGTCSICMADTTFEARAEWLRDNYICRGCGSIPRQRALIRVLNVVRPMWRNLLVHENSPTRISEFFSKQCPGFSYSYYFEDVPLGHEKGHQRCENLEQLTFRDDQFDLFITQDVMEHVFAPQEAFSEIMRVLKPGGLHLFTTPKHKRLPQSRPRARLTEGRVEYLMDAQYHESPVSDGRSLVTWDYGADFEDLVGAWSGYLTSTFVLRDRRLGLDGEYLDVFVTAKIPVNHVRSSPKKGVGDQ